MNLPSVIMAGASRYLLRTNSPPSPPPPLPAGREMRRIRKWGDPVMLQYGFDVNSVGTTNFQAVRTYNKSTGFGAVTNFIRIDRDDIDNLHEMQIPDNHTSEQKMSWLCGWRGKIYMYDNVDDNWRTSAQIRWGTVSIGGNLVQVERYETFPVFLNGEKRSREMARLVGFRKTDWGRPLTELLALGLVHRCYCVYKNNQFGDSPNGIVYSPFYGLQDWDFAGQDSPDALYLPTEWFED
jgi:hypothetical protein